MTNTTTNRPQLRDFKGPDGEQVFADAGAQRKQGDHRPMKACSACGGFVVFVQSTKTGKYYLADCFQYHTANWYYVKASPHFKTCQRRRELAAEMERQRAVTEEHRQIGANARAFSMELQNWMTEQQAAGRAVSDEEYAAKSDELWLTYGLADK